MPSTKLIMCYKIINGRSCIYSTKYFFSTPLPAITIVFLCLCHRLIQFLIDPFFFVSVVPLWNSLPSPYPTCIFSCYFQVPCLCLYVLILCVSSFIVYCSPFYFWGSLWTSIHLLFTIPIMLTSLSCN